MIIAIVSGRSPKMYGNVFLNRRYIAKSFAEFKAMLDALQADEWYGNGYFDIHDIHGMSYEEMIDNEKWLADRGYFFTEIK